ncbi:MAG: hypothetical protein GY828_05665 [Candidatus Gracilibacteria bacterium]|nr:hypothetical protein [Candidatus Gracilibacteria bacterium]
MSKKVQTTKKSKSKELVKPLTKEKVKERMNKATYYDAHPDRIYEKLGEILSKPSKEVNDDDYDYMGKNVRRINNFHTSHVGLANTQEDGIVQTSIVELTNELIKEYECNTISEKSLCEVIANSYGKIMQISQRITNSISACEFLSNERTNWINMLSKEQDRANRSYLTALNNLIELKRPQMNINVKTKNAYFGQNQQFNNNETKDENIKD